MDFKEHCVQRWAFGCPRDYRNALKNRKINEHNPIENTINNNNSQYPFRSKIYVVYFIYRVAKQMAILLLFCCPPATPTEEQSYF